MKKKNIIKISAIVFSIILVIVAITTTTQSYFNKDNYAKNPTEYQTGLLSIEAVSKSNNISLSNTLPMSDTEGGQIEPYVFTIKNNGNVDYKFNIKLLSTSDNTFSPEYIKLKIDDDGIRTLASLTDSIIKEDVILPAGETIDITLRVWLSSDTKNTQIGKTFNSKIVIDGQSIYTSTNQEVQTYTIEYDTGGGTTIPSEAVTAGNKLTLSSVTPKKSGYTFKGWSTSSTATAASYHPGQTITVDQNTKLYAVWEANTTYTLKITGRIGVERIYYHKSPAVGKYLTNVATPTTIIVNAIPGETYYYYGEPSTGYSIISCTASAPCSVTMGTSDITKTITATLNSSSSSYTVTIKQNKNGTISTLTTESITAGESFSYNTAYSLNDGYNGISCTNKQTPIVDIVETSTGKLKLYERRIQITSVTANTTCTLTYGSGGTVTS